MWESLFVLDVSVWEKLVRTIALYLFLLVALRLSGKRLMAQLTTFDFVVLLLVSNAVQNGLIGDDDSVSGALVGASALLILNGALAYLFFRSRRAERIVSGSPVVLIRHGEVDEQALRRQRFTRSDLKIALQDAGVTDVKSIEKAHLEPNGQLLVRTAHDEGPSTAELLAAINTLQERVEELAVRRGDGGADAS
jgi:uncharacterized membrane protein YcaP (DUF421 family)